MTRDAVPPFARRASAIAFLVALLWALYALGARPVITEFEHSQASIEQSSLLLVRYQRVASKLPRLQHEIEALRGDELAKLGFMDGDNETLVTAELQTKLKELAESRGGEVRSTQVLPARDEQGFRRVRVRLEASIGMDGLLRLLHAIESSNPFLFIDTADLRARPNREPAAALDSAVILESRLDVSGFMRTKPK
jgi:general secretion pathway protein M